MELEFNSFDVRNLYGGKFYSLEAGPGSIEWKIKPESKVFFILNQGEFSDKSLTELLKKIVTSIGLKTDQVGFGLIKGRPKMEDFYDFPGNYGVVFGREFLSNNEYLQDNFGTTLYFATSLRDLENTKLYKTQLWEFLQTVKEKI